MVFVFNIINEDNFFNTKTQNEQGYPPLAHSHLSKTVYTLQWRISDMVGPSSGAIEYMGEGDWHLTSPKRSTISV